MNVNNLEQLLSHLGSQLSEQHCLVVGIDGKDGTGKTTLAREIAKSFGGEIINIDDDYLERNKGGYRDFIRYEALKRDFEELEAKTHLIVIEGVCLLEILDKIGRKPGILIYVKRITQSGLWADGDFCNHRTGSDRILERIEKLNNIREAFLDREIGDYHVRYEPLDKATHIYHRVEE